MSVDDVADSGEASSATPRRPRSASALLRGATRRIRAAPTLVFPFLLAGLVVWVVDALRLRDPVPATVVEYGVGRGLDIQLPLYPMAVTRTTTAVDAVVGLKLRYLAWVVGLELLSLVAVVVAGTVVVARVTDTSLSAGGVARYGLFVTALRLLPSVDFSGGGLPVGLALFVVATYVAIQLFAVPALLVEGQGFSTAIRESRALASGVGGSVFGLLVALGLGYTGLALVPVVGPVLSTAVVGTLYAVVLGLFVERAGSHVGGRSLSPSTTPNPANASD